jgi:hypothetical protein
MSDTAADLAAIRKALLTIPRQCRYHGDDLDAPPPFTRQACCEAGYPSRVRREALAALDRLRPLARMGEALSVPLDRTDYSQYLDPDD